MWDVVGAIKSVTDLGDTIMKTAFPSPEAKASAEAQVIQAKVGAVVTELHATQAVMLAEAQSADPWTSRARPAFLYVIYVLILAAIPMGIIFAVNPSVANNITVGFGAWLDAIPESIIQLFGIGYLGYTGARTFDKWGKKK